MGGHRQQLRQTFRRIGDSLLYRNRPLHVRIHAHVLQITGDAGGNEDAQQ